MNIPLDKLTALITSNRPPYPKGWKKTPAQISSLWVQIDAAARGITTNHNQRKLSWVKSYLENLKKAVKQLERAEIAEKIDGAAK